MIPNLKMGYFHKREYLGLPCNIQMSETLDKKPLESSVDGFEYSSLLTSKTYSILSYIVGGFVGSKSQMNNDKHNLSYDLSAAIFNVLNPCKYEKEKNCRKSCENFYATASKISPDGYKKYIVKSSQKEKMIDLGLEWFENYMLGFQEECYNSNQTREDLFNCDVNKLSSNSQINTDRCKLEDRINDSVDPIEKVLLCGVKITEENNFKHSVNSLVTERFRQLSECSVESTDSESFIIFDGPDQEDEKRSEESWKLKNFDFDSDIGNDDADDDDDVMDDLDDYYDENIFCDDYEICSAERELVEANKKWKRNYEDVETQEDEGPRKVRFDDNVKVNKILAWDYAYRAARPGPWEQMARDRVRFRERILRLSPTISPILKKEHRDKIYKELFS